MPKKLLIASSLPTFQPFNRPVCTIIRPMTAARNTFPPNTLAALTATITGRNAKAVLATISRNAYQSVDAKEGMALPRASTTPIIRPEATMAGRMGTNTSPTDFNARFHAGCLAAAAAFTSSFVAAVIPVTERNSSYTLFTVPVPMMS